MRRELMKGLKCMRAPQTLRRGDTGEAVRRLQERLQQHGYEVGEVDGRFDVLTEDALLSFQRDRRLRADGIAGPRSLHALEDGPAYHHPIHVVRAHETVSDIARLHGISVDALGWMNSFSHRIPPRTGRRLVIWRPYVLVGPQRTASPLVIERVLRTAPQRISGLTAPTMQCENDGSLGEPTALEFASLAAKFGWDFVVPVAGRDQPLATILTRRRSLRRLAQHLHEYCRTLECRHLLLDLEAIPWGGGGRIGAALVYLRNAIPDVTFTVGVPPLYRGWRATMSAWNPDQLVRTAEHVLLNLHRWEHLVDGRRGPVSFDHIERWVAHAARRVPPWRLWLGVPLAGYAVDGSLELEERSVTYRYAVIEGLRHHSRPIRDEHGFLRVAGNDDGTPHFILQGRDGLLGFLRIALRYRLAGIYLDGVGGEDRRLWDVMSRRVFARPPGGMS